MAGVWGSPSKSIPRMAAGSVIALGALAFLEGFFEVGAQWRFISEKSSMSAIPAASFALSGAALWCLAEARPSRARALALAASGVAALAVVANADIGVDLIRILEQTFSSHADFASAASVGSNAALGFLMLGFALLAETGSREFRRSAQWLALSAMAIAAVALVGYAYDRSALESWNSASRMAIPASIALLTLGVGVLQLHPDEGLLGILNGRGPGALLVRKLLPIILLGPFTVGWLRLEGQRAGLYPPELGVAVLVVSTTWVLAAVLLTYANGIDSIDAARRTAEGEVRESEERMRFALSAARAEIWNLSMTDDRVEWSEASESFFADGPAAPPRSRKEFFEFVHPDDRAAVLEAAERAFAGRTDFAMPFRTLWPDGSTHWIYGQARAFHDDSGRPTKLSGVAFDMTDRKALEDQLHQVQNLESIGQLAGGVAHDFNNVLTAILGYSELLLADLGRDRPERADVEEIRRAGERAAAITQQLLAFSRRQFLQPRLFELDALVRDLQPIVKRLVPEHVEILLRLAARGARVRADPAQIEQVLLNLVINARDAMSRGGRMTIETSEATLEATRRGLVGPVVPGRYVLLTVTDSGAGMTPQVKRQIFDPFFTTKEIGQGSGLGLATVYGIVRQSNGYIGVESEPGEGSSFEVYLPRTDEMPATTGVPAAEIATHTSLGETLLVVDDERDVRRSIRRNLERLGYRVLEAGSPAEALQRARAHPGRIDLLLSDVVMPGSGDVSLFDQLRAERSELRVLYMSGHADEVVLHQGLVVDGRPFLKKPFAVHALAEAIRKILDLPVS